MFEVKGTKEGRSQGVMDAKEHRPRNPKPRLKYAVISNSYIKSYLKSYHKAYSKAENDKAFLRRQELIRDRFKKTGRGSRDQRSR